MDQAPDRLGKIRSKISIIRQHLDRVLIIASGITILVGGYFTVDYRNYTNCQVRILEASQVTTTTFADSLRVLLTNPPRPVEERLEAFRRLQEALDHQRTLQTELGNCK